MMEGNHTGAEQHTPVYGDDGQKSVSTGATDDRSAVAEIATTPTSQVSAADTTSAETSNGTESTVTIVAVFFKV